MWAAWQTGVSEQDSDIWVRSKPAGGDWDAPERIAFSPVQDLNVRIAVGQNNTIHAVWRSNETGAYDVLCSKYEGGSWSFPVNFSATGTQSYYPDVAADSAGNVFVVWIDEIDSSNGFDILFRRYDGTQWLPAQRASDRLKALWPAMTADGCNLYVTWTDFRQSQWRARHLLCLLHRLREQLEYR